MLQKYCGMGWIGGDLDGTLAESRAGQGACIGKPVGAMVHRIRRWLGEGREVRIFTVRAAYARCNVGYERKDCRR